MPTTKSINILEPLYEHGLYSVSQDPLDSTYCVWYGDSFISEHGSLTDARIACDTAAGA